MTLTFRHFVRVRLSFFNWGVESRDVWVDHGLRMLVQSLEGLGWRDRWCGTRIMRKEEVRTGRPSRPCARSSWRIDLVRHVTGGQIPLPAVPVAPVQTKPIRAHCTRTSS